MSFHEPCGKSNQNFMMAGEKSWPLPAILATAIVALLEVPFSDNEEAC